MPKPRHASLWPSTLKSAPGFDFGAFLQAQAVDLKRLVDGVLDVTVERRIVESVIMYNFTIILPKSDYRYQLFSIRTIGGVFPARIVAPHMPEPLQVLPVADENELKDRLREVFRHASTEKVIATLESEERASLDADRAPPD